MIDPPGSNAAREGAISASLGTRGRAVKPDLAAVRKVQECNRDPRALLLGTHVPDASLLAIADAISEFSTQPIPEG